MIDTDAILAAWTAAAMSDDKWRERRLAEWALDHGASLVEALRRAEARAEPGHIRINGPAVVRVRLKDLKCRWCGADSWAVLDATRGGYAAGTTHDHAGDCPTNFCDHGVRWPGPDSLAEDQCADCEVERQWNNSMDDE